MSASPKNAAALACALTCSRSVACFAPSKHVALARLLSAQVRQLNLNLEMKVPSGIATTGNLELGPRPAAPFPPPLAGRATARGEIPLD
jgi:hypothetical protein